MYFSEPFLVFVDMVNSFWLLRFLLSIKWILFFSCGVIEQSMTLTHWCVRLNFIPSETYKIPLGKRDFSQGGRRGGATIVSGHCYPSEVVSR